MGNLYADALQWESSFDIMMMGSGSIRKKELGPVIEYQDMVENTPFDDNLWMVEVTGEQFTQIVKHLMRDDAWKGETEFYQFSQGVHIRYNKTTRTLEELTFHGEPVTPDMRLKVAVQNYHYKNFDEFLGVPLVTYVRRLEVKDASFSVECVMDDGVATVEGRLPAVMTVLKEADAPRYAPLSGAIRAAQAQITVLNEKDIAADPVKIGLKGSPTKVVTIFPPPVKGGGEKVVASGDAAAKAILSFLERKGLVKHG